MSKYGSDKVAWFLIGGLDLVGALTEFEDKLEARTEESHGLSETWAKQSYVGVKTAEITQNGFYDDVANGANDVLSSGPGATNVLCYTLEGTATGVHFVGWSAGVQVNYKRGPERDGLTKANAKYTLGPGGIVEQGKVLHTYKAVGSTGRKGVVDLLATSTGLTGYLQYNASAGEANVKIMHSASGGTSWAALITFTKTASGHTAERVVATGDVLRYVCADFTTASATGAIAALNAFVGIVE